MFFSYCKLTIAALIPAITTALLYRLDRAGRFGRLSYTAKQILFGVIFGAIAVLGTEWGIPLEGAVVNCRDAAPLCAGLFFGGPAGILAGSIGALERWFSVYWGVGSYTRLACTLATFLAGLIAAGLRKTVFDSRRPHLLLAAVAAFMVEALHQSMVFFLHLNDAANAAAIVRVTAPPMLTANTLSVLLASALYAHMDGTLFKSRQEKKTLSVLIERNLLVLVLISFLFTTAYAYILQTNVAKKETESDLNATLREIESSGELGRGVPHGNRLNALLHRSQIGTDGHLIALDTNGTALTSSRGTPPREAVSVSGIKEGSAFTCRLYGEKYFAVWHQMDEYLLLGAVKTKSIYSVRDISALATFFVQIFIYGLLFAGISLMLRRSVVRSIRGMNETLGEITSGDLDKKVEERGSLEFSRLSDDINATVDTLKTYIAEAKARNEREMNMARDIQLSALPRTFPAFPKRRDIDIYALTQPAREVGGDFYDFYFANGGRFYILVADVSGKGIPAAMFMMRAKTALKGLIETGCSIEEAFCRCNSSLCEGNDAEMFVTAWMAEIDPEAGTFSCVNAGHNPPVVSGEDGTFSYLKTRPGFVLAGMDGIRYKKESRRLRGGDRLILYTDGVTEAEDPSGALYGEDRLLTLINANAGLSAQALGEKIREDVLTFTGEAEQFDDITVLVFDYFGEGREAEIRFENATTADLPEAAEFLENTLRERGCSEKALMQISVALDEVFSNIVNYGYPDGPGPVTLRIGEQHTPHAAVLTFIDEGIPYDPLQAKEPDITLSAEERTPGGLGIFLVKKMMDEVNYEYKDGKNVLTFVKRI